MAVSYIAVVKPILDKIVADWTTGNGNVAPDFPTNHRSAFQWDTAAKLLASSARGLPMVQPAIIGQAGQGHTANIVIALTVGVAPFPPMPDGGLDSQNNTYLAANSPQIQTIIQWIEGGCLP